MNMKKIESAHEDEPDHQEKPLSDTGVHGIDIDISTVIDFFGEVNQGNEYADAREENPGSQKDK